MGLLECEQGLTVLSIPHQSVFHVALSRWDKNRVDNKILVKSIITVLFLKSRSERLCHMVKSMALLARKRGIGYVYLFRQGKSMTV